MAANVTSRPFGRTKDGREVTCWRLEGAGGLVVEALDWGGKIVRIDAPDGQGRLKDVAVGFDSPAGWEAGDPYYGAIIGRVANRIGGGTFTLDGVEYKLVCNNAPAGIPCSLHGADGGWHDRTWSVRPFVAGDDAGIVLSLNSPDGEGGYPGSVDVEVAYTVTAGNAWRIDYSAAASAPTPISLTQHVYFNLKGEAGGSVEDHTLQISAANFLPYGPSQVPTGEVRAVAGTPFDFTAPRVVGERIGDPDPVLQAGRGYDHYWVFDGSGFRHAATLSGHGRRIELWTDELGMQVYTGNWFPAGLPAKGGDTLSPRCGIALETGHYPDSPNKPNFPSVILRPGAKLASRTEYRFLAE